MIEDAGDLCVAMTLLNNKYNYEILSWMIRFSYDNTVPQQEITFMSLREPLRRINCKVWEILSAKVLRLLHLMSQKQPE